MKTSENLKQQLHSLIDSIEDVQVLKVLSEDIIPFVIDSHREENNAPDTEEMAELEAAFKKMEEGEYATLASFREAMSKWRTGS